MKLYWDPKLLSRSTTRQQWKEMYGWSRKVTKIMKAEMEYRMANAMLYGTTHPELWDKITNPPLLIGPGMPK